MMQRKRVAFWCTLHGFFLRLLGQKLSFDSGSKIEKFIIERSVSMFVCLRFRS
jgi:hypothetical protein